MRSANRSMGVVDVPCRIERKDGRLPRFLAVRARMIDGWKLDRTTIVEASIDGFAIGRRSLKQLDEDRWFIELAQPMCERAGVDTGDRVKLSLRLASDDLPDELATLLARDRFAQAAWAKLTAAQQRMLREEVIAAKRPETRRRRAECGLALERKSGSQCRAADGDHHAH